MGRHGRGPSISAPSSISISVWKTLPTTRAVASMNTTGAFDAPVDRAGDLDLLGDDHALDMGGLADRDEVGVDIALDGAVDVDVAVAFELADDLHVGGDHRVRALLAAEEGKRPAARCARAALVSFRDHPPGPAGSSWSPTE